MLKLRAIVLPVPGIQAELGTFFQATGTQIAAEAF